MLNPSRLFIAVNPVDFRKGMDALMALARQVGPSGHDQAAWVFRNKSGNRLKVLFWDGLGFWLCIRRLDQGRFHWPEDASGVFELTPAQFSWLVDGIDWRRLDKENRFQAARF